MLLKQVKKPVSYQSKVNQDLILEMKYPGHTNKTKVSWSYHDPNIFISGSLDKKIFLWDSRKQQKVIEFSNKHAKVKHVQFSLHSEHLFAAGLTDG